MQVVTYDSIVKQYCPIIQECLQEMNVKYTVDSKNNLLYVLFDYGYEQSYIIIDCMQPIVLISALLSLKIPEDWFFQAEKYLEIANGEIGGKGRFDIGKPMNCIAYSRSYSNIDVNSFDREKLKEFCSESLILLASYHKMICDLGRCIKEKVDTEKVECK